MIGRLKAKLRPYDKNQLHGDGKNAYPRSKRQRDEVFQVFLIGRRSLFAVVRENRSGFLANQKIALNFQKRVLIRLF
ncbi:hypothetical protein Q757_08265 [Oenococcus alcoholitolerans]|uniref:Transposase n=1 Tax=Oenococcus alcoholitolerans TaxID=931074 RepID=A0ABR4XPA8_9LACO|nr:hypothetical protein Q757_08265 [Oenococcus alcoholitolerans]